MNGRNCDTSPIDVDVSADPTTCLVCQAALPSRDARESRRGRPRLYCSERCKDRQALVRRDVLRVARYEAAGQEPMADLVRRSIDLRLALWRRQAA